MLLGKMFHSSWQKAGEGARVAAAAISTGAKAVGQIPVVMAHLENAALRGAEAGLEVVAKAELAAVKGVAVTTSEWKAWMDVKAAQVLQAVHVPVDAKAVQRRGEQNTQNLRRGFEGAQKALDAGLTSMRSQVEQANAKRLKSAETLQAKISETGARAGKSMVRTVDAIGKTVEGGLKKVDGVIVDVVVTATGATARVGAKVAKAFQTAKSWFGIKKVGDPKEMCLAMKPDARKRLFQLAAKEQKLVDLAKRRGVGADAKVKDLEAHVDASKKLLMADDVYNDDRQPVGEAAPGWKRLSDDDLRKLKLNPDDFHPGDSKFRAALYRSNDNPPKYTMAFKGTTMTSESDWKNNIRQGLGLESDHYQRAQRLAQKVKHGVVGDLEVTGHSLGGGLAAAAAAATGTKGVTFNAAGLNPETVPDADMKELQKRLVNYHVDGEVLTTLQHYTPGIPEAPGRDVRLAAQEEDGTVGRHLLPALEEGMLESGGTMGPQVEQLLRTEMATP